MKSNEEVLEELKRELLRIRIELFSRRNNLSWTDFLKGKMIDTLRSLNIYNAA